MEVRFANQVTLKEGDHSRLYRWPDVMKRGTERWQHED